MISTTQLVAELLRRNIAFRYRPEQLASLQQRGLGLPWEAPRREVQTASGLMVEEAIPTSLEPVTLPSSTWTTLQRLGRAWTVFFRCAFDAFREDLADGGRTFRAIGTPTERTFALQDVGPGPQASLLPFVRLDCLLQPDGRVAVLDVNTSRPTGIGTCIALSELQTQLGIAPPNTVVPDFTGAVSRALTRSYADWGLRYGRETAAPPSLAIVIPEDHGAVPDFKILGRRLKRLSDFANVDVLDPSALRVDDGRLRTDVARGSRPIPLVLRAVKADLRASAAPAIAEAFPNAACIVAPLYRRWLGSKLWFAFATQEPFRSRVASELRDLAPSFFDSLPECGLYESGSVAFADRRVPIEALDGRDWVVKVASGSSARGVIIGRSEREDWLPSLLALSDQRLLLQRFVEPSREILTFPTRDGAQRGSFLAKFGLYVIDGEAVGCELHACPDSYKIHGGRGTLQVPVVHEKAR